MRWSFVQHIYTILLFILVLRKCTTMIGGAKNETIRNGYREAKLFFYAVDYDDQAIHDEEFDFVIVGSGSSGSAIANRLSEISKWKVLLVEAGLPPIDIMDAPAYAPVFQFTPYNWNDVMEKQDNVCLGLKEQRMNWPRGRGLGGSSLINYMIHVRGNKLDYDKWSSMGNPGWSYKDLFRYFVKLEDARFRNQDANYHGRGGPIVVEDVKVRTESAAAFVDAVQQLGYDYVDYNGRRQIGVSYVQATVKDGRRCSGEKGYLRQARDRTNLKILKRAYVTKIIIDPKTRETKGIRYQRDGKYYTAKARKEVVLSAGSFNSPQLLMLSGIGPKDHLDQLKIQLLQDLPVGQKLYDHLMFPGLIITLNESIVFKESLLNPLILKEYYRGYPNIILSLGGVEALAYFNLNLTNKNPKYPDIELIFLGGGFHTDKGLFNRKTFRVSDRTYNKIWRPLETKNACQIFPMLVHPLSHGRIKLRSRNPYDRPKLYGNFFTDPNNDDVKTFVASIRLVQKIIRTPAFRKYDAKLWDARVPGCEKLEYDSDSYWECCLRHLAVTLHHQVATCKMGPSYDPEAVVDNYLRVYGIKKLRVADSSVIPLPLTAHTNVPAFVIGEKASDIIKSEYLSKI